MNNTNNNKTFLAELKKNNRRVMVEHYRMSNMKNCLMPAKYFCITNTQNDIVAKGGMSLVTIQDNDGKFHIGMSVCHKNDNFNRSRGLMMALNRIRPM